MRQLFWLKKKKLPLILLELPGCACSKPLLKKVNMEGSTTFFAEEGYAWNCVCPLTPHSRPRCMYWSPFQVVLVVKKPPASAGDTRDTGSIPRSGRSPGEGHSNTQYSCLENPMDRGAWRATVQRVTNSQTRLSCQPCWCLDLGHPASKAARRFISVVFTSPSFGKKELEAKSRRDHQYHLSRFHMHVYNTCMQYLIHNTCLSLSDLLHFVL